MNMNAWQDGRVNSEVGAAGAGTTGAAGTGAGAGTSDVAGAGVTGVTGGAAAEAADTGVSPVGVRDVTDAGTLKALADPLRLSILAALMRDASVRPRVMSVKELAAELGEPQTKLYRHVKLLEAAGLIRVAASRLVSGIVEQRYQACQTDLRFGPGLMRDATADESAALVTALFDQYRDRFLAAQRALGGAGYPDGESYRKSVMSLAETTVSAARAAAIRERLQALIEELDQPGDESEDGVPVSVLIAFYSPADQP
jgi:DNA-binding transcriptional ArsR family regulator